MSVGSLLYMQMVMARFLDDTLDSHHFFQITFHLITESQLKTRQSMMNAESVCEVFQAAAHQAG